MAYVALSVLTNTRFSVSSTSLSASVITSPVGADQIHSSEPSASERASSVTGTDVGGAVGPSAAYVREGVIPMHGRSPKIKLRKVRKEKLGPTCGIEGKHAAIASPVIVDSPAVHGRRKVVLPLGAHLRLVE